jgi:hypothetical protein
MQSLCNQSVTRKMSWSVGGMAGVMINARRWHLDHFANRLPGIGDISSPVKVN